MESSCPSDIQSSIDTRILTIQLCRMVLRGCEPPTCTRHACQLSHQKGNSNQKHSALSCGATLKVGTGTKKQPLVHGDTVNFEHQKRILKESRNLPYHIEQLCKAVEAANTCARHRCRLPHQERILMKIRRPAILSEVMLRGGRAYTHLYTTSLPTTTSKGGFKAAAPSTEPQRRGRALAVPAATISGTCAKDDQTELQHKTVVLLLLLYPQEAVDLPQHDIDWSLLPVFHKTVVSLLLLYQQEAVDLLQHDIDWSLLPVSVGYCIHSVVTTSMQQPSHRSIQYSQKVTRAGESTTHMNCLNFTRQLRDDLGSVH